MEDDPGVRQFVRSVLAAEGYTVTAVTLPQTTGPALAARLRSRRPDMGVVYLADAGGVNPAESPGAPLGRLVVWRPIVIEVLVEKVRRAFAACGPAPGLDRRVTDLLQGD